MASPEEKLIAAVSPLVGGRLFPDFAPQSTARPYAVWQQVGGERASFIEGGGADKRSVRIQVEVWSDSRLTTSTLIRQIEAALISPQVLAEAQGGAVATLDDANLRGAMQDFMLYGDA